MHLNNIVPKNNLLKWEISSVVCDKFSYFDVFLNQTHLNLIDRLVFIGNVPFHVGTCDFETALAVHFHVWDLAGDFTISGLKIVFFLFGTHLDFVISIFNWFELKFSWFIWNSLLLQVFVVIKKLHNDSFDIMIVGIWDFVHDSKSGVLEVYWGLTFWFCLFQR